MTLCLWYAYLFLFLCENSKENKYSAKNNRKYSDLQQNTENPQQNYKNTEKIHQNTEIQIHVIKIDSFNKIEIK